MNYIDLFRGEISELMTKRGATTMHITGIRHGNYCETADTFIDEAAHKRFSASLFPEMANSLDHKAVVCRRGRRYQCTKIRNYSDTAATCSQKLCNGLNIK